MFHGGSFSQSLSDSAFGRLETVLFQFPHSFHYEDVNHCYLGKILDKFSEITTAAGTFAKRKIAVEIWRGLWYTGYAFCCCIVLFRVGSVERLLQTLFI